MGVSKNRGKHPKMDDDFIIENPINPWMILGGKPTIFGNIYISYSLMALRCFFSFILWIATAAVSSGDRIGVRD